MKILDQLISSLDFNADVKDIRQGVFHTAVLTRNCGLAATLPRDALKQEPPMVRGPGFLTQKTPRQLAELAYSDHLLEAAMGMAAINSLIKIDSTKIQELNAAELILNQAADKRVAIVGHFPFVPKIRQSAREIWVIEKNPQPGDATEDKAEELIPRADIVAITGTALTNHSLPALVRLCRKEAFVLMLGDTVPLSPILFDFGIDAVCGTQVVDPQLVMRCVSQGANFRQIKGTRRLTILKNQ